MSANTPYDRTGIDSGSTELHTVMYSNSRNLSNLDSRYLLEENNSDSSTISKTTIGQDEPGYDSSRYQSLPATENTAFVSDESYRLYRRRWIGLAELTLLNFAIGWGTTAPSVISTTAIEWFSISYSKLNWLSISSSFVFLVPAPFVIWILNRYGPRVSITLASFFTVVGGWLIYASARAHSFPLHVVGSIIQALASPFIIAAPTRYSRMWFDDRSRTLATALPSLANPMGSGIGALTGAHMVKPLGSLNYDGQALIIAIVFTIAALPTPFLPTTPPTPPSAVAAAAVAKKLSPRESIVLLLHNRTFYLQLTTFGIFAASVETVSNIANQALAPYGFRQETAGNAIAFLIFVGIGAALLLSPLLDRTKAHLWALKVLVVLIAAGFTALPFVPQTGSVAGVYALFALIGASSLSIEPCVLEFQASWTHPVSPEFSSVICWCVAKVLGGIFVILVGDVLVAKTAREGQPRESLFNGLVFMAVMCWAAVPVSWLTGLWIFKRPELSKVEGND